MTVGTSGWMWLWGRQGGCDSLDVRMGGCDSWDVRVGVVTVRTPGWV